MNRLSNIALPALSAIALLGCVPDTGELQSSSPRTEQVTNSVRTPAVASPVASTETLSPFVGSFGPSGAETVFMRDGSFKNYINHNGRRRLIQEGYIGQDSRGRPIMVKTRNISDVNTFRMEDVEPPIISGVLSIRREAGIQIMVLRQPDGNEIKYIKTSDHARGYGFSLEGLAELKFIVTAPQANNPTPTQPTNAPSNPSNGTNATVSGPAASCVRLGWENNAGAQARVVQNTCSRAIVVRVCHVARIQQGECQLQSFTNPLEHNFGQLMLDGNRPKWRTNWYQSEGAATNLRFYAKYI